MEADIDYQEETLWEPTPKQFEFLSAPEIEVLYGGAAGGGKSDALLIDALGEQQDAISWSRYQAIIFRITYFDLSELIDRSREIYPEYGAKFNEQKYTWRFPSGAKIILAYMAQEKDRFRHKGKSYQYIAWDELTEWATDICYRYLFSRLRSTNPKIKCYVRATTNPGGVGHQWVQRRWRIPNDGAATNFREIEDRDGESVQIARRFIPSKLTDNPHLTVTNEYRNNLLMLSDAERKKLLHGRWDVVEGQYFTEWNPAVHVVDPFEIPPEWVRWRALDWGYRRPYSVGWYAMSPDGVIYRYREKYGWGGEPDTGTKQDAALVAQELLDIEALERKSGIKFYNNPADPSIWTNAGHGKSIAEHFPAGYWNSPFQNKSAGGDSLRLRINGWNECRTRLRDRSFFVFRNCKHFIRTVPLLVYDDNKPEDLNSDMEDHVADEWRYSMVSRHNAPRPKSEQPKGLKPFTEAWIMHGTKPTKQLRGRDRIKAKASRF